MKYNKRYMKEFKRDYYHCGKHDLAIQVPHLDRLASYYENRYNLLQPQHWTDCLKAHTLCNAAAARAPLSEGWKHRAFSIQQSYWGEWSDITYNRQSLITQRLLNILQSVRDNLHGTLGSADKKADKFEMHYTYPANMMSEFAACMQRKTVYCTDEMVKFAGVVIDESVKILNRTPPCDFSVVGLGSLARGETTPYSDLEYMFIVDRKNPEIVEYFEHLAVTSYFLIGNLKETNLKYMHIAELQGWFDDRSKSGFKIDGLSPGAGNIPTGNGQDEQLNHFIVTPEEIASKYSETLNHPDEEKALRGDLTAMLTYMKPIYNHGDVAPILIELVRTNIRKTVRTDMRKEVNNMMLKSDITKFNFSPSKKLHSKGFTVDVKREVYRFPSILLLDISIVTNCVSDTSWATCDKLLSNGHITIEFHRSLKFMLACACYLRLSSYLYLDSDSFNDGVSVAPKILSLIEQTNQKSCFNKWFIPVGLYTVACQILMSIRQGIQRNIETNMKSFFLENLNPSTGDNLWRFKLQALYSAGRFKDCLHVLQTEIGEDASAKEIMKQLHLPEHHSAQDQTKLLEEVADIYARCAKPQTALDILLYLSLISDNDQIKLKLAECYQSLGEYKKALDTLSDIEECRAECLYLTGCIYSRQQLLLQAEQSVLEALQVYIIEASLPCLYDYYGHPIIPDLNSDNEQPDLSSSTAEDRLNLIPEASTDIIKCVRQLGIIYRKMGRHKCHNAYDKKAENLLRVVYGDGALVATLAAHYNSMAGHHYDNDDYEQSEQQYLKALEMCEDLYGKDSGHEDTIMVLSNLGVLYYNKGDYNEAAKYTRRALIMYRNGCGEKSSKSNIISLMNIQADIYKSQKRYSEALGELGEILVMMRDKHGGIKDHLDTAKLLRRVGRLHTYTKQYDTADDYLHQSLAMYQRIHGPDSPNSDVVTVLYNIACNHEDSSDYGEAGTFYNRALEMYRTIDSRHDNIADCLHRLGRCQKNLANYWVALEYYREALTMRRGIYCENENSVDIANIIYDLGVSHYHLKQYAEAEVYYQQALTMYKEVFGTESGHSYTAKTLRALGIVHYNTGQFDKCVKLYSLSLDANKAANKDDSNHIKVASLLNSLGIVHKEMKEYSKALGYYYQSLNIYKSIYRAESNHLNIADLLNNLAVCYDAAQMREEAKDKFREALSMYRAVQPNHRNIHRINNYLLQREQLA